MASGHVNRTQRPNTWLHRPSLRREDSPCQLGAVHTWPIATNFSLAPDVSFWVEADLGRAAEFAASVENALQRHGWLRDYFACRKFLL